MNNTYTSDDPAALATYLFGDPLPTTTTTSSWWKDEVDLLTLLPLLTTTPMPPTDPYSPPLTPKARPYRTIAPAQPRTAPPPLPLPRKRKASAQEDQDLALKRQKNTDAARRSRMKKLVKMEHLHSRVATLEAENGDLTTRLAVLTAKKDGLQNKEQDLMDRIHVLEAQLANALQILATR